MNFNLAISKTRSIFDPTIKNNTIMTTTENTLTDFQKDYFNFCIETYKNEKKVEPSIKKQIKLIDWITKNYEIDFNMICVYSGKVLTGKAKLNRMFLENMGYMENILDW